MDKGPNLRARVQEAFPIISEPIEQVHGHHDDGETLGRDGGDEQHTGTWKGHHTICAITLAFACRRHSIVQLLVEKNGINVSVLESPYTRWDVE